MADDFDRLVADLQQQAIEQALEVYSAAVVGNFYHPQNMGRLQQPDAHAVLQGPCGDTMEFFLHVSGRIVRRATFITDGCGPTVACGSVLTTLVEGLSLEEAATIEPGDLIDALGGLPEESVHCARLAVGTLRAALATRD
jgi:nitrogen fixation NifU-like protein